MIQGTLVGLALLLIAVSPFFALALPISKGTWIGWSLWGLSVLGMVLHWRAYLNTGDIYYTVGDTIKYNGKKADFTLAVSFSFPVFASLILYLIRKHTLFFDGKLRAVLILSVIFVLSIAAYHATASLVKNQNWGIGRYVIVSDGKGDAACE